MLRGGELRCVEFGIIFSTTEVYQRPKTARGLETGVLRCSP